uniref:Uncharacterized protein n=1 Tax=Triticum urartu TaxID=4572 RepID=A0A8R7PK80_TRIUA
MGHCTLTYISLQRVYIATWLCWSFVYRPCYPYVWSFLPNVYYEWYFNLWNVFLILVYRTTFLNLMSQLYSNKSARRELFYATPVTGTRKIQSTVPPMNKAQSMRCLHQLLSSHHGHGFDRRWTSPITYSNSGKYPMIYDATSSCDVPCKQPCDLPLLL